MKDIERLFAGNVPVPGMRPSERLSSAAYLRGSGESEEVGRDRIGGDTIQVGADDVSAAAPPASGSSGPGYPLAVVESVRGRPGTQLVSAHELSHPHGERLRLLRTELLLRHSARRGAVGIAVVGAGAGEGRSQLAAELALSFAQLDRSTLLLDADMRRPRQHALFGLQLNEGLAQAIIREEVPALFSIEGYPTLSLLTAGVSPPNPLELLSDGRFESLMEDLRDTFEFIIVDTPSCGDFADGVVVATVVGDVLTVHRAGHTPYKAARSMLRQLESARARILGGVLNHF